MALDADNFERLSAYLDGELSPAERAEIERWLERDAEARSLFNELRQVTSIVAALPRERAPTDMADAVVARCERAALLDETGFRPRRAVMAARWTRPLALAASLLVVATIAWIGIPYWPKFERSVMQVADMDSPSKMEPATESSRRPMALNDPADRGLESAAVPSERIVRDAAPADLKTYSADADREHAPIASVTDAVQDRDGYAPPTVTMRSEAHREVGAADGEARETRMALGHAAPESVAMHDAATSPPTGRSDVSLARPAPSRANDQPSGGVDHAVSFGSYTNREVQSAPISAFSNRVDVAVDDPKVVEQLDGLIRSSMEAQAVPDMASAAGDEALPADRAYFFKRDERPIGERAVMKDDELRLPDSKIGFVDAHNDADASDAYAGGARVYVLNLQRSQAAPLLVSMQTYLETQNAASAWMANEQPVAPDRAAVETVRQLVAGPAVARSQIAAREHGDMFRDAESGAVEEGEIAKGATQHTTATESEDRADVSVEAKSGDAADAISIGGHGGDHRSAAKARGKSSHADSSGSGGEFVGPPAPGMARRAGDKSAPVEQQRAIDHSANDAEFVTLAVRLRSDPALRAQRRIEASPPATQTPGKATPASQPAAPTSTQPATSESSRG